MKWTVSSDEAHTRLDQWLAHQVGCSRAEARRLIDDGAVRVSGRPAKKGTLLLAGAEIELARLPPTPEARRPTPEPALPLEVLFTDDALVALAKPAGAATHPLRPGERGTLAGALAARFPECAGASDDPREGGVAHRLDIDTSGVVLAARTRQAWQALRAAFAAGRIEKEYLALVTGAPPDEGEVDAPLAHAGHRRKVTVVEKWLNHSEDWSNHSPRPRPALTRYRVLARSAPGRPEVALVRAFTSTGRMHQVRAHLAHAGFPLVGDTLYGGPPAEPPGHLLHAARIRFPHPVTGAPTTIDAPLPEARRRLFEAWLGAPPPV